MGYFQFSMLSLWNKNQVGWRMGYWTCTCIIGCFCLYHSSCTNLAFHPSSFPSFSASFTNFVGVSRANLLITIINIIFSPKCIHFLNCSSLEVNYFFSSCAPLVAGQNVFFCVDFHFGSHVREYWFGLTEEDISFKEIHQVNYNILLGLVGSLIR